MNEQEVVALLESSTSAQEWNENCDKIKRACGGYPPYWWSKVIQSGLADKILARFGESTEIKISHE